MHCLDCKGATEVSFVTGILCCGIVTAGMNSKGIT